MTSKITASTNEAGIRTLNATEVEAVTGGVTIGGRDIKIGDRRDVGCGTMVILNALFGWPIK